MQSLSGHTSGIDSVSFDSSEVLVAAGAASGTIKLWDLEEAKSMLVIYSFTCINTGILHISIVSYSLSFSVCSCSHTHWPQIQLHICRLSPFWRVLCIWFPGHKS